MLLYALQVSHLYENYQGLINDEMSSIYTLVNIRTYKS
jgi:hypothetical protein